MTEELRQIEAGVLRVAYYDTGPSDGVAVFLMHGFPYDVHCYTEVCESLRTAGYRVVTPYLRGYGPTRFLDSNTLRSGQQAALGQDLLSLMDALHVDRAVVAGYDWGGRAACIVSALWPDRVIGLVSAEGYNVQNIARAMEPARPEAEHRFWYQYYFHSERGRAGLAKHRYDYCKLLWQLWSPRWHFNEQTYATSALAFENPDFVDVVIHSYRHRYALVSGDPAVQHIEEQLALGPKISVPTIGLYGDADGVAAIRTVPDDGRGFSGPFEARILAGIGHNPPQEHPTAFAAAVMELGSKA